MSRSHVRGPAGPQLPAQPQPSVYADEKTVVLIGSTGAGKSTLCNFILGIDSTKQGLHPFAAGGGHFGAGVTTQVLDDFATSDALVRRFANVPVPLPAKLTVIDTPGFGDSNYTDEQFRYEMAKSFVDLATQSKNGIHGIIVAVNGSTMARFDNQSRAAVAFYSDVLDDFWGHSMFVMTNMDPDVSHVLRSQYPSMADVALSNYQDRQRYFGEFPAILSSEYKIAPPPVVPFSNALGLQQPGIATIMQALKAKTTHFTSSFLNNVRIMYNERGYQEAVQYVIERIGSRISQLFRERRM
eukprot:TRINITY_DN10167_c0_g1_i1.p1 TRINITY_DN10167_c0_g1~~TRINITY_DN10167_c0_g1_i1.p1  ORF type:complete len:298 (-),score=58.45 TRINITY_DN10167_c0_g1_i1:80-973(-)